MKGVLGTIPDELVPASYQYDPQVEDVVRGHELKSGMIVVLADAQLRGDPKHFKRLDPEQKRRLRLTARWARVLDIKAGGKLVSMTCAYADGPAQARVYDNTTLWYVKADFRPSDE